MPEQKKTRAELKSLFSENSIPTADDFAALIDSGLNRTDDQVDVTTAGTVEAKIIQARTDSDQGWLSLKGSGDNNGVRITGNSFFRANKISTYASNTTLTLYAEGTGFVQVDDKLSVTGGLEVKGAPVTIGVAASGTGATAVAAAPQPLTVNGSITATDGLTVSGGTTTVGGVNASGKIYATSGMEVSGSNLNVINNKELWVNIIKSHWGDTNLVLSGQGTGIVVVDDKLSVTGGLEVKGAPVTIGVAASGTGTTAVAAAPQPLTVNGLVTANAGLTVTGAAVTIGTTAANQNLTVNGSITATGFIATSSNKLYANGVTAMDTNGNLVLTGRGSGLVTIGSATEGEELYVYGPLTATGLVTANSGLTVTGAGVTIGVAASGTGTTAVAAAPQPLTVNGTVTAGGKVTANAGLDVAGAALTIGSATTNQSLILNGVSITKIATTLDEATDDRTTIPTTRSIRERIAAGSSSGALTAGAAISPGTVTASGKVTANAGLDVAGAALTIGSATTNQSLILNGASITRIVTTLDSVTGDDTTIPTTRSIRERIAASTSPAGAAISPGTVTASGLVTANAGLTVTGAGVTIGTTDANQPLTVNGNLTVNGSVTVRDASPLVWNKFPSPATGTAAYAIQSNGIVVVRGELTNTGTVLDSAYHVATLPRGFRPEFDVRFVVATGASYDRSMIIRIMPSGRILAQNSTVPVVLDSLNFTVEPALQAIFALKGETVANSVEGITTDGTISYSSDTKFGMCAWLNNASYIKCANLACTSDFTFAAWVKMLYGNHGGPMTVISYGAGNPALVLSYSTALGGYVPSHQSSAAQSSVAIMHETWSHIAITQDANGRKTYLNGALTGKDTVRSSVGGTNLVIGASETSSSTGYSYSDRLKANIANVRVYTRALEASEINRLYTNNI